MAFQLLDRVVVLVTPSPEIAPRAANLIPEYAVPFAGQHADDLLELREEGGVRRIRSEHSEPEGFTSLEEALDTLEFLVSVRLLTLTSNLAHLHAAGAVVNGKGILALGHPGAGKTSVAMQWSRSGLPVLGDDVVLIDENSRVHPFKRLFLVESPRDGEESWFDPSDESGWANPASVGVVAPTHYDPVTPPQMEDLPRAKTLSLLTASLLPTGMAAECFDRLLRVTNTARAVEITFNDSARAAEELRTLT